MLLGTSNQNYCGQILTQMLSGFSHKKLKGIMSGGAIVKIAPATLNSTSVNNCHTVYSLCNKKQQIQ